MNSVGRSASGVRHASRSARCPSTQACAHAVTSCTSPATRLARAAGRVEEHVVERRVARRAPSRSRSSALSCCRRALADDQAVVDDRQPVAELVGLLEVLRGEEDGRAALVDAPHLVPDRQPARGVQARSSARRGTAPRARCTSADARSSRRFMPPRVALDAAVGGVLELDEREQLVGARRRPSARGHAEQPRLQDEQLAPGLARVEPGLLQRDADLAARRVGVARRRRRRRRCALPDVIDSSVVSILHGRRLAGAVRARGSRRPRRPRPAGRRRGPPRRPAAP